MVNNKREHSEKTPAKQGAEAVIPKPNKIGASTPYDFNGTNMTAYGGLLPVATMLEKLGFQQLIEETLTIQRLTRPCPYISSCWPWCWRCTWGFRGCTICGFWSGSRC